ncbi:MAG: inositol monophosphatase [Candidatus Peribacteraceae bacterium]|jgi:myo-inositol-1(or 4)-monophosphatase|nr:inositol monophosphatase [Candidatus Peribacteraceae bacterium]
MSDISIDQLIAVSREVAEIGSGILEYEYDAINRGNKKLDVSIKSSAIDLVTEIDGRTQEAIVAGIQKHFPDHRFIGEEEGAEDLGDPSSPYEWIIDPLDGTTNFIHGKHSFGSIIAVQKDGVLIAGAMHLPLLDQWYWGGKGAGAYYNGDTIKLRETESLQGAILNCNLIHRAKEVDGVLTVTLPSCRSIENTGCAAEELGEILMGHTDGVFFDGIRLWDIAAGFLLVEEAGGKMAYEAQEPGNPKGGYTCAASTAQIFDDLWAWTTTKM